jgi:hypothetical protein
MFFVRFRPSFACHLLIRIPICGETTEAVHGQFILVCGHLGRKLDRLEPVKTWGAQIERFFHCQNGDVMFQCVRVELRMNGVAVKLPDDVLVVLVGHVGCSCPDVDAVEGDHLTIHIKAVGRGQDVTV